MKEKKSSISKNIISLNDISWHPCCAPEIEIPGMDIVSTHVGKKVESKPN